MADTLSSIKSSKGRSDEAVYLQGIEAEEPAQLDLLGGAVA